MKVKIAFCLSMVLIVSYAVPTQAADDNKLTSVVKTAGKGIMWGPKKLFGGLKAVGGGMKKKLGGK